MYDSVEDAKEGKKAGGCGFFVSLASEKHGMQGWAYRYAITCLHNIDKGCLTIRVNTERGGSEEIVTRREDWEDSEENDIAAYAIDLDDTKHVSQSIFHRFPAELLAKYPRIPMFITREIITNEGLGMGDDVFLIGRLIDHSGTQRNTPSARFGHISMMPFEPIRNLHLRRSVDAFFCEIKSIGGFSGSPVFVHIPPLSERPRSKTLSNAKGPWLLGIDWGHTQKPEYVVDDHGDKTPEEHRVQRDSGIACVAPAWEIAKLLDCKRFRKQRIEDDKKLGQGGPSPAASDLAAMILSVSMNLICANLPARQD